MVPGRASTLPGASFSYSYFKVEVQGHSGLIGGNNEAKESQEYKKGVIAYNYSSVIGRNVRSGAAAEALDQVLDKRDFSNKTANEEKGGLYQEFSKQDS